MVQPLGFRKKKEGGRERESDRERDLQSKSPILPGGDVASTGHSVEFSEVTW